MMLLAWSLVFGLYLTMAVFLWGAYALFKGARKFNAMAEALQKAAAEQEPASGQREWKIEVHEPPIVWRPDSWHTLH